MRPTASYALVALCLVGSRAAAADDVEIIEYTVRPGDTCAAIAQRTYGDERRVDLIHQHNVMGPPPHALTAGTKLRLPKWIAGPVAGPDARLHKLRNSVEVQAAERRPGKLDDPLYRGNRVATQAESSAGMLFRDETVVQIGENTLVVIVGDTRQAAKRVGAEPDAVLLSGALRSRLGELAGKQQPLRVATPSAEVNVGGGRAQVHVDEGKSTRLAVYQGKGDIAAQKKTVAVDAGFGSKADVGVAPTPPRPLPPPPLWAHAPPRRLLTDATGKASLTGSYGPGASSAPASYRVQLATDELFDDLVVDRVVPRDVTHLSLRELAAGRYLVRVSAIDDDRFEGEFGPVATVEVSASRWIEREPAISSLESAPQSIVCAVDGAAAIAATAVRVDRHAAHRVVCAEPGELGGGTEFVLPALVAIAPPPPRPVEAPPPAPVQEESKRPPLEIFAGGGLVVEPKGDIGQRVELGFTVKLGGGSFFLGVGPVLRAERHDGARASTTDVGLDQQTGQLGVAHTDFTLAAPFALRFEPEGSAFGAFVALAPELTYQRAHFTDSSGTGTDGDTALAGAAGSVGALLRVGALTPYLEVGVRDAGNLSAVGGTAPLRAFTSGVGARYSF